MTSLLSAEQKRLKSKHGTPEEFAKASRMALGEISIEEMDAAVAKYQKEWDAAAGRAKWWKITVSVMPKYGLESLSWIMTQEFEDKFKVPALYYARYRDMTSSRFEISALTNAPHPAIKRFFRKHGAVTGVKIVNRDPGSFSHAFAYQAVKRLALRADDEVNDRAFLDLIHWAANMRGYDYQREIRFYAWAATCFSDMLVKQAAQAEAAQEMVNYLVTEKGQAGMKKTGVAGPAAKTAKSVPAAPRRASAPKVRPCAGSGRR